MDQREQVTLQIDGMPLEHFEEVTLDLSVDSFSQCSFTCPWEPDRRHFRSLFRPFTYRSVVAFIGELQVFTGTLVGIEPDVDDKKNSLTLTAYAKPGVLQDCNLPISSFPAEFAGMTLGDIAGAVCDPFKIKTIVNDDGAAFRARQRRGKSGRRLKQTPLDKVALESTEQVLDFLVKLAKQRGLVITDDYEGSLVLHQSAPVGNPVATFREGEPPLLSITPQFSPQEYYSEFTGVAPARGGRKGDKYTLPNPFLTDVLRPLTFEAEDVEGAELPDQVADKRGRTLGNMASFDIEVPTFFDPRDFLFEPNTTVKLLAPGAMVYTEYEFLVRSVSYNQTQNESKATMNLVIPGAFSGEIPDRLPWDEF